MDCCKGRPSAKKELCRLQLNWFFLILLGGLGTISYTSVLSSFHQFITNPTAKQLNKTEDRDIDPGLGSSEAFYSWVLTAFHFGATFGAIFAGFLVKLFPYWHTILASLILHTFSYIIYAVATQGWLIIISKLLSGVFIGMEKTVTFAYFGESYNDYLAALERLGKEESKSARMKDRLFALHSIGVNAGYLFGPGAAVVLAQLDVDQFRSVAWYNVAGGISLILLQIVMVHGESKCRKALKQLCKCKLSWTFKKPSFKLTCMGTFIVAFVIFGRSIISARYCVYEALFNPVLSDSFGFSEREGSYFFLGIVVAQILGAFILLGLQQLKLNSRVTAIIGITLSIGACILIADWQSIQSDHCTHYSLFHHPELAQELNNPLDDTETKCDTLNLTRSTSNLSNIDNLQVYAYLQVNDATRYMPIRHPMECLKVTSCSQCNGLYATTNASALPFCLHFAMKSNRQSLCLTSSNNSAKPHYNTIAAAAYACQINDFPFTLCIENATVQYDLEGVNQIEVLKDLVQDLMFNVHSQSLQLVEEHIYNSVREQCEALRHSEHKCHWVPDSLITKKRCHDCQPICRGVHRTLNFFQFCVGAVILMLSIPIGRESLTAVLSDNVGREFQGLVMGIAVACSGAWRAIALLWLEASYEAVGKRTYLPLVLMIASLLPVLVGLVVLYHKLGYKKTCSKEPESDSDDSDDYYDGQDDDGHGDDGHGDDGHGDGQDDASESANLFTRKKKQGSYN